MRSAYYPCRLSLGNHGQLFRRPCCFLYFNYCGNILPSSSKCYHKSITGNHDLSHLASANSFYGIFFWSRIQVLPNNGQWDWSNEHTAFYWSVALDVVCVFNMITEAEFNGRLGILDMDFSSWYQVNRAPIAQLVEHRVVMREVVSSTPAGRRLRVLK